MSVPRRRLAEVQIAVMLLSRLPAGRVADPLPTIGEARWAFPLCGAGLGLLGWAVFAAADAIGLSPLVSAGLAVATGVVLTGGLHEDGLADFADGLGAGRDRARALEIMRDSRIGSFGVIALCLAILLKTAAIAGLDGAGAAAAFAAVGAGGRFAMVVLLDLLPPARQDGLGHAASRGSDWRMPAAAGIALIALVPLSWDALALALAMAVAGASVGVLAARRLGGQTGDVLGACQQIAETAGWIVLAGTVAPGS